MTVNQYATPDQVERWVFKTLMGEYVWCQLFSEPDAGSDAAAVTTRGTRVDGGWKVNGQKVWTSGAQYCDLGLATVRTNPDAPKHAGITTMVIDMHAPGVEVRPLRQITGNADFNEVFFNDVFVPDDDVVGTPDDGWTVARSTLGNERVSIGGGVGGIFPPMDLLALLKSGGDRVPGAAARIGAILTKEHALKVLNLRRAQRAVIGSGPGPEGNVTKLVLAEHGHDRARLQADLVGAATAFLDGDDALAGLRPARHAGDVHRGRDVGDHPEPDRRAHSRAAPGPADQIGRVAAAAVAGAAARSDAIATVLRRRSCGRAVVPCTQGMPVGDRYEGGQCRRAPGSSRPSKYRRPAPPLHEGRHRTSPRRRRRVPQRAIEIVGIVIGIAFIAAVARAHDLSNDEFWSLAAGQWMLAHHAFMGLDPFSYTESHRRWVTDEWGSEIALAALFRAFGDAAYACTPSCWADCAWWPARPTPVRSGRGAAGSPPSSSCSPSASPASWWATGGSTSPWSGSRWSS